MNLGITERTVLVPLTKKEKRRIELELINVGNKMSELVAAKMRSDKTFAERFSTLKTSHADLAFKLKDRHHFKKMLVQEYLDIESNEVLFLDKDDNTIVLGRRAPDLLDYSGVPNEENGEKT